MKSAIEALSQKLNEHRNHKQTAEIAIRDHERALTDARQSLDAADRAVIEIEAAIKMLKTK